MYVDFCGTFRTHTYYSEICIVQQSSFINTKHFRVFFCEKSGQQNWKMNRAFRAIQQSASDWCHSTLIEPQQAHSFAIYRPPRVPLLAVHFKSKTPKRKKLFNTHQVHKLTKYIPYIHNPRKKFHILFSLSYSYVSELLCWSFLLFFLPL